MTKYKNQLRVYRHRRQLSQDQVVEVLENEVSRFSLSRFETGNGLPPLRVALALEILYRIPIAFCYPDMYNEMRERIRKSERLMQRRPQAQAVLF